MIKMIKENQSMKYRVIVNGKVITECPSMQIANNLILSLPVTEQENAIVVPVTTEGKQVLNETSFV